MLSNFSNFCKYKLLHAVDMEVSRVYQTCSLPMLCAVKDTKVTNAAKSKYTTYHVSPPVMLALCQKAWCMHSVKARTLQQKNSGRVQPGSSADASHPAILPPLHRWLQGGTAHPAGFRAHRPQRTRRWHRPARTALVPPRDSRSCHLEAYWHKMSSIKIPCGGRPQ